MYFSKLYATNFIDVQTEVNLSFSHCLQQYYHLCSKQMLFWWNWNFEYNTPHIYWSFNSLYDKSFQKGSLCIEKEFKAELNWMTKIKQASEPIEWINSLEIMEKPNLLSTHLITAI